MKQVIQIASSVLITMTIFSCNVFEIESTNYAKSSTYFANQTPFRTLILGDNDTYDNTKDNNLQFSILANIGGLSGNTMNREVGYMIDESLAQNLFTSEGDTLVALPQSYYTLSPTGKLIVPKGRMEGTIDVQLDDSFLNDPEALKKHYVIPLRLISTSTDSILQGKAKVENPDPRIAEHWTTVPKNYTLFGIKYINKYYGNYFYFGKTSVKNQTGIQVDETIYNGSSITDNSLTMLNNSSKNSALLTVPIHMSYANIGNVNLDLIFDDSGSITVSGSKGSSIPVTGTGTFVNDGSEWGGKKRNMIALDYTFSYNYFVQPTITKINNADSKVSYTGTWTHNSEAGNYNGDRSYSSTLGSFLKLEFFGYRIAVYTKTSTTYGKYDVYIDDELVEEVNTSIVFNGGYQCKTFEKTGLANAKHTLKCVIKTAGKNCIFDYFETESGGVLPNGTYSWNVKDTLVMHDRAVELESFIPVIK